VTLSAAGLNYEQAHLVKMANQIAANVPNRGEVADQVATHMHTFWTPEMQRDIQEIERDYPDELVPDVHTALEILRRS
jgi:hypothetical protein